MSSIDIGWLDIALLAFLALSVLIGVMRGFVFELLSLVGWVFAYFVALWAAPTVLPYVHLGTPGSPLNYGVAFAGIFVVALIAWGLSARLVRALIRATPLGPIDRVLGAGFGLLRGLVVLLIVAVVVGVSPAAKSIVWQQSQGAVWLNAALKALRPLFDAQVSQHPSA